MLHVPIGSNTFGLTQPSTTARPAAAQGALLPSAVGSKGSWSQLLASTTDDTYGMLVCINSNTTATTSRNSVVDIGIGAASSEVVLVPDLLAGNAAAYTAGGIWYYFPLFIKAGTRISARAQSTETTDFNVFCQFLQRPANPSQVRKASFVEAIGATAPDGVSVTGGSTSKGAWTQIGTTASRLWWWQFGIQVSNADTAHILGVQHVDIAVGNATDKDIIISNAQFVTSTNESSSNPSLRAGVEFPVAAGSNIYARIQSSGTPDPYELVVYGAGG